MDNERHRIVYHCRVCHDMLTIVTAQPEPPPMCCVQCGEWPEMEIYSHIDLIKEERVI